MRRKVSSQGKRVEPWDVETGRRIRTMRIECGMSQTTLATKLGITFQQVQKYEKGVNRVSVGRLVRVAEALNVPISFFFDGQAFKASANPAANLFPYLQSSTAVRMVKAFHRITSPRLRRRLAELSERIADTQ
jgi:transcriptional regulator with XRE-family HTH domain